MNKTTKSLVRAWAAAFALAAIAPAVCAQEHQADPERYRQAARFKLTDTVVNPHLAPFTATVGEIGNAIVSASFEPATFRTRFFAEADADDRIVLAPHVITHYDVLREGFYDGAEVRAYRILDGRLELVRRDRVPEGGSAMSGWLRASPDGKLVPTPPEGGACAYVHRFDDWERPDVSYWFSVTAVDEAGNESLHSNAVEVRRTSAKPEAAPPPNELVEFKPSRPPAGQAVERPSPPTNLHGEYDAAVGAARLVWTPVTAPGIVGYRIYRSDYPPEAHRGYFLQLAGGPPSDQRARIRKGDWIVVDKTFTSFSRNRHHSNRVWGSHENKAAMPNGVPFFPDEDPRMTWTLDPHGADSPVADGGATALKVTLQEGAKLVFAEYNHAGTGQSWYEVLDPTVDYVVEFWARQEGMARPRATFKLNGHYARTVEPLTFEIGGEWRLHRATFRVPALWEGGGGVGQTSLSFEGPGTVWLDNYRIYAADAPFLDYRPYEYAGLKASGMGMLRTHAFIKTGSKTYSMEQITNPGGVISGVHRGNTLPQTLQIMRRAGVQPWLQIEPHMTREEWLGLVEYLAAPYDPATDTPESKPWAAKRHAQGRAEPWTAAFDTIFFEIGNETWNWLFTPWVFEGMTDGVTGRVYNRGEVYGIFQEYVIACLRASPWWSAAQLEDKFRFVLGGWRVQEYGLKAVTTSPNSHYVMRAGYNGGWDEGEGPAEGNDPSLFRALLHPGQSGLPEAAEFLAKRERMVAEGVAHRFGLGTYEAGPGYALSGLNNQPRMSEAQVRAQEETMKSLAAGTATLDTFLGRARYGYEIQNFFTFFHGRTHWVSHTAWHKGAVAHPCWMTLALFNNEGRGDMLAVETLAAPTVDVAAYRRRPEAKNVPLAACYATRRGDRLNLFVLSRKLDNYPLAGDDGFTPVTIELPLTGARSVTLYRMTGDPRAHNLDGERVRIERVELPAETATPAFIVNEKTGADARGLPPGATLLYVFDGVRRY